MPNLDRLLLAIRISKKPVCSNKKNVYLALSVWKGAADLLFIVYGQNQQLGFLLEEKVRNFLSGNGRVRSTQSVPISKLVNDFGMTVYAVSKTPDELYGLLQLKNGCRRTINKNSIKAIAELEIYCNTGKLCRQQNMQ